MTPCRWWDPVTTFLPWQRGQWDEWLYVTGNTGDISSSGRLLSLHAVTLDLWQLAALSRHAIAYTSQCARDTSVYFYDLGVESTPPGQFLKTTIFGCRVDILALVAFDMGRENVNLQSESAPALSVISHRFLSCKRGC